MKDRYPLYLANRPLQPNADLAVVDKFTGGVAAHVALADKALLDRAIAAAADAAAPMRKLSSGERKAVLKHLVARCEEGREELADVVVTESGKPIQYARSEVARLIATVEIAAEESTRIYGEVMSVDDSSKSIGYRAMWQRWCSETTGL